MARSAGTSRSIWSRKRRELLMSMFLLATSDDLPRGNVQRGKEGGGAMAVIIMRAALGLARSHRQDRLAAIQRLHLAFFVNTKHHGALFAPVGSDTSQQCRAPVRLRSGQALFHEKCIGGEFALLL